MNQRAAMLLALFLSTTTMICIGADNKKLAATIMADLKLYSVAELNNLRDQLRHDCFGFITSETLFSSDASEDLSSNFDAKIELVKKQVVQLALLKNACLRKEKSDKQGLHNSLASGNS